MATPKKPTSKKQPAKKPAAKSSSVKTSTKRTTTANKKTVAAARHRMFAINIVPDTQPFMTFRLTTQTIYWLIFAVTVFALGLWVLKLNLEIVSLYDQIDQNNIVESQTSPIIKKPAHK